jgi:hypothetical protein
MSEGFGSRTHRGRTSRLAVLRAEPGSRRRLRSHLSCAGLRRLSPRLMRRHDVSRSRHSLRWTALGPTALLLAVLGLGAVQLTTSSAASARQAPPDHSHRDVFYVFVPSPSPESGPTPARAPADGGPLTLLLTAVISAAAAVTLTEVRRAVRDRRHDLGTSTDQNSPPVPEPTSTRSRPGGRPTDAPLPAVMPQDGVHGGSGWSRGHRRRPGVPATGRQPVWSAEEVLETARGG